MGALAGMTAALVPVIGQVRGRGRVRGRPVKIQLPRLHPIRRPLPATVIVREPRKRVVVGSPLKFLPAVPWSATIVTLPPGDRLIWQDSETIERDEEWVDCNFGVDEKGRALILEIGGAAQLNFAEVTFNNGEVQVVDFADRVRRAGTYQLLDFADGRHVMMVRVLAKADSDEAKLTVYMAK